MVLPAHIVFYWQAVGDGAGESHFISIFQFAAKGNTPAWW